ncbi:hypothetical protein ATO8_07671 [Roseivivax marinus]|uniref:GST N-terminal domain-containing protein n=1 Tax=Roseivivax marinus TaxID=1379903 RepID=W4HK17_9RHOB|nr:glutathione S-transferase [Roseivivax marinus]ETW13072.1 hypothetical protein ATO8_07671 [Roseivivax marinus]
MTDYTLYYWPLPFRGQFVRTVLAHVGADWSEAGIGEVSDLRTAEPAAQLVPHMGRPVLTDHSADLSLAQTQAILAWLGDKHGLIPGDPAKRALTHKVIADTNDVLYEMTRYNGAQMWTPDDWDEYRPRLGRWMEIFEALGRAHGLTADGGHMLGTEQPGLADLTAYTLWGTMTTQLPPLRRMLDAHAPGIAGLVDRIGAHPEQRELWQRTRDDYGDAWCGGQIEDSLRRALDG